MPPSSSVRTSVLSFVLAVSLTAPAMAKTPPSTADQVTLSVATIGIDNFGEVNPNYFRGSQPKGRDFAKLAGLGVKLVIDLASEGDPAEGANAENQGMKFVRIPLTTDVAPSTQAIERFLSLVNDPANQPVYVHCMGGRHRTGALTAVYRMTRDGWTADRAFSEMKEYKFGADFLHPQLKTFVFTFFSGLTRPQGAPRTASVN